MYTLYMVRCVDGTLYTGITRDAIRRLKEHNSHNKGAKYTRSRRPVVLVYTQSFDTRSLAQKEEYRIKQLTKREKELLCSEMIIV